VTRRKKLGLIVNPVAGIGGRVGLKGSDGREILARALALGAVREAPARACLALDRLAAQRVPIELITCPGEMGADEARACGFEPVVLEQLAGGSDTTPEDTVAAAHAMAELGVDLLLFAGGDGTARNVLDAVADRVPVLGIPAGVKIHSAVYATTPSAAGDLAAHFLGQRSAAPRLRECEVMDIDEAAFRAGRVSAGLYGYLLVPYERALLQSAKMGSIAGDPATLAGIAADIVNEMQTGALYIIGPGTTTRAIAERLGVKKTLLGVDVVRDGGLIAADASERDLLRLLEDASAEPARRKAHIVVTVIGGQGHILGRGNQQISPSVIRACGVANIVVVATQTKLVSLQGRPLLCDSGDPDLDRELSGYTKVITGAGERTMYRVSGAAASLGR
jgi:predicted polyphosphate/ATP-dependent NAD kinase